MKTFFRISEVARRANRSADSIRRDEARGFIKPHRNIFGIRLFDAADVERLKRLAAGETFLTRSDGTFVCCARCGLPVFQNDAGDRANTNARQLICRACNKRGVCQ